MNKFFPRKVEQKKKKIFYVLKYDNLFETGKKIFQQSNKAATSNLNI